ncbi:MAG TPA: hypothetical protein VK929_06810 [Longimicrobiales bacterium]|nr:hypothetical protein [Longimicrobiales bacterium]
MKRWLALLAPLVIVACGEEGPTDVGGGLLAPDAVRTFEVFLEPHQYMVFDTAFGLYSDPVDANFTIVAHDFDDGLDSHGLMRFGIPSSINVVDTLGVSRLDQNPAFIGGTLRMIADTLRSSEPPVLLALYRTTEAWDGTATWTHRRDSADVQLPWSVPGGVRGVLVDTATYAAGDTLQFRVDSATIAAWRDTDDPTRGAMIVAETPGSRVRLSLPALDVQAVSSMRPDTVYTTFATRQARTFIFTPEQPATVSELRVGGTPSWRSIIRLQERLDTVTVPCPGEPGCRVRLGDVMLSHAGLRLQPVLPPPGLRPEAALVIGAYVLAATPLVPLQRSPLTELVGVGSVPASRFLAPGAPVFELSITELFRRAIMPPEQWPEGAVAPTHLALAPGPDPVLFGFATFESMPRLRLIVSTARELQLP